MGRAQERGGTGDLAAPAGAAAERVARAFYVGEAAKLGVTVVLFVVIFVSMQVSFAALIGTYIATLFVYWLALFYLKLGWAGVLFVHVPPPFV